MACEAIFCVGCNGLLNCVEEGAIASNRARSGVTVRKLDCCDICDAVGLAAGCDDHENAGVCGVLGTEAIPVEGALAGAGSSQLPKSLPEPEPDAGIPPFPLTRASKSSGLSPLVLLSKVVPVTPPNARKSSLGAAFAPLEVPDSSCSFLVCSSSTRLESSLISAMNVWNCFKSNSGPKLMLHSTGRMSIATKSASATCPTIRKTFKAAIMTAGSFVLIALIRGTIFSCMVYLSRAVDDEVFLFSCSSPLRPSSLAASLDPPHRTTNDCKPRTLIAKLFVLLKTVATTGNNSFLIVLKSSAGKTLGKVLKAASTMECVGHSIAAMITGKISFRESATGLGQSR